MGYGLRAAREQRAGTRQSFDYVVAVAPNPALIVTPDEFRTYISSDPISMPDDQATAYILAAQGQVEAYTKLALLDTQFRTHRNEFYDRISLGRWPLDNPVQPTITYLVGGVETVVDTDIYKLVPRSFDGYISLKDGQWWPSDQDWEDDAITILFNAGYLDVASVPQQLKFAVMQVANWMFANQGDCAACGGNFAASEICTAKTTLLGFKKLGV